MNKKKYVFKDESKNKLIKKFSKLFSAKLKEKNKDVLYAGIMLVDRLAENKIPEYTGECSKYIGHSLQRYYTENKQKNIRDEFDKIFPKLKAGDLEGITSVLITYLQTKYRVNTVVFTEYEKKPVLYINKDMFKFDTAKKTINNFNSIFRKDTTSEIKKNIYDAFMIHYETIQELNINEDKICYWLFYPITYNFIRKEILLYLTIFGTTNISNKFLSSKIIDDEIADILRSLMFDLLIDQIGFISFEFYKQDIKSAIAAIMSRNGSHNIGSHVLAAVGNNYNDLPDDQNLFKYIQHRMDYIAQITTEFPDWTCPTWFVSDLMRRFYMQLHLLKYISQSEGLGAYEFQPKRKKDQENKILINICTKKDNKITYIISNKSKETDIVIKDDVQIAIPGGIIGHQAFYTIIENIIRNAAKHGWSLKKAKRPENLEITIEIDDDKKRDFIIFRIWDNISENVAKEMNARLGKSFVDQESGELLKSNWGLAEMKISAGFLNRRDILKIGSDNEHDILFKLDNDKNEYSGTIKAIRHEKQKSLGYEFAIPRPKEVLIIGMDKNVLDESLLQQNNIYLEDELTSNTDYDLDCEFVVLYDNGKNDFINKLKNYKNESADVRSEIEKFPFRLFIVSDDRPELEPDKLDKSGFLSNRIVILNNKDDIKLGNAEEVSAFKLLLYKKWIRHLMKRREIITDNTVGESENIELKVLINLSGDHGHAKGDIVKLVFDKFKDKLLNKLNAERIKLRYTKEGGNTREKAFKDAKSLLESVSDSDIDNGHYQNTDALITKWVELAIAKYKKDNANNISDQLNHNLQKLKNALEAPAGIYFEIIEDICIRYDEDCQTLPKNYRGQNSTTTGDLKDLCIDNGISISITHNENDPPFDIAYNRHAPIEAEYYSEALSGSQIYFSLLQNLADESAYERDKRILQLIENALLRVVIIDERVAQYYSNCNAEVKDRFDNTKFTIPTGITYKNRPLDLVNNMGNSSKRLEIDKIDCNSYDVFIIHQGVLDKIVKSSLFNLMDEIKKMVPFVIITSGRGEPENIPENVKFLPFSNIESFVLSDFPEKYLLTQMAMKIITSGN